MSDAGIAGRLRALRGAMRERGVGALIVTKNDPHISEYAPEIWNGVRLVTGFTGSTGTAVITADTAGLFVDGRYHLQAEAETDPGLVRVFKCGLPGVPDYIGFIKYETPAGGKIGFDGRVMSVAEARSVQAAVSDKRAELVADFDILGRIARESPARPPAPVFAHDTAFCGETRESKLARVKAEMKSLGFGAYIVTSPDDVAWLLNLRGGDFPFCPVFSAFAVIDGEGAALFADLEKITGVAAPLAAAGVKCLPYNSVYTYVKRYGPDTAVAFDPRTTNCALYQSLGNDPARPPAPDSANNANKTNIIERMKAVKNAVEMENLERTAIMDGVSMARLLMWIEDNAGRGITEYDVALKSLEFRESNANFIGPSFNAVVGFGPNAALPHYLPGERASSRLAGGGFLMIDCGGSYLSGTTDITRTVAVGAAAPGMRADYTLVLKAHIALASCVFLYGSAGSNIDAIARAPLWARGLNYNHGTGHGIGFCLNVHEGPQRVSLAGGAGCETRLEAGMLISNEPGLYRAGEYGIRLENIVCVKERGETEFGRFMRFETISYCPFDLGAVEADMLSADEKRWLNGYHAAVFEKLAPRLDERERAWLKNAARSV